MKFTLSWLKEHLDTDEPLAAIVDKLTMIGLEVERVEDKAAAAQAVRRRLCHLGREASQRRQAALCMVDTGDGKPVQVVCGAPNARAGMKGVFAAPGAFIPGKNMTLAVGTIRGVESRGMLMSEAELLLSDDHDGIIDLPADAPVGKSLRRMRRRSSEPVIEITLTPNRADCTGVNGIARDLGAAAMGTFKERPPKPVKGEFPCPVKVTLDFGATHSLCPAFGLRLVRGVKNGASPDWLQERLKAIGLRPINALVDITNFITFDRGRPLHVFDAAKVHGNLTVRRAKNGETLLALDGKTYTLDAAMCVIADEKGASRSPASWAARRPAARDDHRRADRIRRCGTRSTSRRPAASSASIPTRAIASSAASIRPSCCRGSNSRRRWCSNSAAARRRRSWSPAIRRRRKPSSISR